MTTTVETPAPTEETPRGPKPMLGEPRSTTAHITICAFVIIPTLVLIAAVPLAWGWGLSWVDIGLAVFFYYLSGLGVTIGFHRHFTHGSFKAKRPVRIGLAVAGMMAVQGSILHWVADHRRHHAFSDKEGDPHSPWLHGTTPWGLTKGFWHAHMGWTLNRDKTNAERFAPDLLADNDIKLVDKYFSLFTVATFVLPGVLGGLITWSWWGALTAFFWAGIVRVGFLHHVTWSTNSICHLIGDRPFKSKDKAANFWPLAILSFGESWHNLHHADPTSARHGVKRWQLDTSARIIWIFEKFGWVHSVRWPSEQRLARITVTEAAH
ncbi:MULTISPECIES: acyl-CoA desaturase [Crossiella]|uniref:Stearoyl-CoA desaturase (Delta-9 desaturase) n=1 Tax=Crossiella cryophila TaxID=43355 RepID=A0A7W7C696_9PSEU|nr:MULTISPECIES: acyl-CoA desaturase [Crossiella]MBB4674176.1 stearoyl-CoA desaturase (delta-9 desaturase) [Crossiella cryophila]MCK2237030.1 acyl-CoA desaturase [Crossiella sp. S99.2]MCK2250698.1 acyl-CoA desaturase [Crossiella sp. S99.1]